MKANKKSKRGADKTVRRFIVTEVYGGNRKLPDIFSDLLCSEYCRKEQKNLRERIK
jgi:hypothetical protein